VRNLFPPRKNYLRVLFLSSSTLTMFEGKAFPRPYMLGWLAGTKPWPIADIIAHSEFDVRMDMIIEQVCANGFYYGVETETFGNYIGELYVTHNLPDPYATLDLR
jgi:hypothetical protein